MPRTSRPYAGLESPDIAILSEGFLAEVRDLPQKNLALEMLRKLLNGEIAVRAKHNLIESRTFSQRLQEAIYQYQNRAIDAVEAIQQLIELAREMREAHRRGETHLQAMNRLLQVVEVIEQLVQQLPLMRLHPVLSR